MKRQRAELGGRRAEALAALWLQLKGWSVIGRRVRPPRGEVDLVARRGRTLAFVEVKARATAAEANLSLDEYRLRHVPPPPKPWSPATPAQATTSASTPSTSSPAASHDTSRMSGRASDRSARLP